MKRLSILFVAVAVAALAVSIASAAPVGQLESWGTYGTANGQFANATMLGVDPVTGSVYSGDTYTQTPSTEDRESYRLQKFSPTGTYEASVLIPRYLDPPPGKDTKILGLDGIAVDHAQERIYVLETVKQRETSGSFVAKAILVFSTTPNAGKLVPPSSGPTSIVLPTATAELVFNPKAIAVDPGNHDLEILGENKATGGNDVLLRASSAGVVGKRFTDTANSLKPGGAAENATSIAIGPTGITYAVTYSQNAELGGEHTQAWEIPSTMTEIKKVAGFATAAVNEAWPFKLQSEAPSQLTNGPQVAISPDGSTLYFKEWVTKTEEGVIGNYLVRGFSLKEAATTQVYGGGSTSCKFSTPFAGLGVTGEGAAEKVVVFDFGQLNEVKPEAPLYGGKVLTFGRGGSGCPAPTAKFKANGTEGSIEVAKGATVSFDASGSELASGPASTPGFRRELVWNFGDGTEEVIKSSGATEAVPTVSHTYTTAGAFKATLQIHLKTPTYGNPLKVEHAVTVSGAAEEPILKVVKEGTGSGTVVSAPTGINCGATCEAKFPAATPVKLKGTPTAGSKAVVFSGCDAVNGSNECEVTLSAAKEVKAKFAAIPNFTLKVTKEGTGSGTVVGTPAGINCGATCEASFAEGTLVKLKGTPTAGSNPVAFSGCDAVNVSGECEVTLSAAREVKAIFSSVGEFTLVVKKEGTGAGAGTVVSTPAGINCGATCSSSFAENTLVKLKGTAGAGSKAVVFTGCDAVNGSNECEVTMSAAKEVKATFTLEKELLKVAKEGNGAGTVTSEPAGINCGSTCEASFDHGTVVKLKGTPTTGSVAVVWSTCPGTVNGADECEVTLTAAKEAKATFTLAKETLTVTTGGGAPGTVASSPGSIACPGVCSGEFDYGTAVTLTATPGVGATAVVWAGCDSTPTANECAVSLTAAKSVTATFAGAADVPLEVAKAGAGSGTVVSTPTGINCGADCEAEYVEGTVVKLRATPSAGSTAVQWSGCAVSGDECEVTLTAATEVTATFGVETGRLAVSKVGSGAGYVSSKPAGIGCGGTCQGTFPLGTDVVLTGTSGAGTQEVAWSGCGAVISGDRCEVAVALSGSVTAAFYPVVTAPPAPQPVPVEETVKKLTKKQKALAHCKTLKGKAKQRCVKKANQIGKKKTKKTKKQKTSKSKKHHAKQADHRKRGGQG